MGHSNFSVRTDIEVTAELRVCINEDSPVICQCVLGLKLSSIRTKNSRRLAEA